MKRKSIYIYVFITLIFFGLLWKIEYATDTYAVFNFDTEEVYAQFASSGRFITAIVGKTLKIINTPNEAIYMGSYILAIICTIVSQYKLFKIIKDDVKSKVLQIIIPTLIIINPFSIELFLFIEKGIMLFGVLMCIYAVENLIRFFKTGKKKNILFATMFMFLANFSYQGIVGIFVSIALVYILKYSKNIKEFIKNNLITACIYGVPALVDYLMVKLIYKSNRLNGEFIFVESLRKVISGTSDMWTTMYGILPQYVYVFAIFFTFLLLCCKLIGKEKTIENENLVEKRVSIEEQKPAWVELLKYFYIIIGVTVISVIPQLMQSTSQVWLVARSTYCFASLFGILILYLNMEAVEDDEFVTDYDRENAKSCRESNRKYYQKEKNMRSIIIVTVSTIVSAFLLLFQLKGFWQIEQDRYKVNAKDEEISKQIVEQIKNYEEKNKEENNGKENNRKENSDDEKNNTKIQKIAIYEDNNLSYTYDGIFATGDINIKAYSAEWSTKEILEFYLNRELTIVDKDENLELQFLQNDWSEFSLEQIDFIDDVIILCRY